MIAVLAVLAGTAVHAQEAAPAMAAPVPAESTIQAPDTGVPSGATTGLPFANDNANQPVLQPLTPGAAPIESAVHDGMEASGAQGAENAHGEKKGLPQFDLSTFPRQLAWLTLTFAFLYLVFARKTLPAIGRSLETREQRIAGDLNAAEQLKADVARVKGEYEAAIAQAQTDAQGLINGIQADMKRTLEARDAAFKAKAEEDVSRLEDRIDAGRARAVAELNSLAADLAADITARVAGVKADASAARAAIDAETGNVKAA